MSIKENFAVSILDFDKITDMNNIILKYADITMQSSSYLIFDKQPLNTNEPPKDFTIFQLTAKDKTSLNKKLNEMIKNLDQLGADYALRNQDTGEMLVYVKFVGLLRIKFDKMKTIKKGTYKKIDELKDLNTEFGICKGYMPDFRPIESQPIENVNIKPESIYIYCHSQENLMKLKDILTEKIMEIDSDLEIDFKQYSEDDLYWIKESVKLMKLIFFSFPNSQININGAIIRILFKNKYENYGSAKIIISS